MPSENSQQTKDFSAQATYWLILLLASAFGLRLLFLFHPPADDASWNQCTEASIVRHFIETKPNPFDTQWELLRPESSEPYVEIEEFPLYHLFSWAVARMTGGVIVGCRLVSIIFAVLGGLGLYLLIARRAGALAGLFAAFFFEFSPLMFFFGRAIGSDVLSLTFAIGALVFADEYRVTGKSRFIWLAAMLAMAAGLTKAFSLHIMIPLIYLLALRDGMKPDRKKIVVTAVALVPSILWYSYAAIRGNLANFDVLGLTNKGHLWGPISMLWNSEFWFRIQWRIFDRGLTPIVSALALLSLFWSKSRKYLGLSFWWLIGVFIYIVMVRDGNFKHNYYQLPAIAPFAGMAGIGLAVLISKGSKYRYIAFGFILAFLIISPVYIASHYKMDLSSFKAGWIASTISHRDERLLVLDPGQTRKTQVLFAAHRYGWHFSHITRSQVEFYRKLGARHLVAVLEPGQEMEENEVLRELFHAFRLLVDMKVTSPEKTHRILIFDLHLKHCNL